ncbi:UPF0547 protein C16orf87 homolog isoform X2 [Dendronephthya gigantea]|uniref:UPF0547 protein C16orf87 homolog isoform X2 n=1 Tax=Dendronephthya gigantea TaxID=151771 RepID=UPI00106AB3E1|nr:UPF0547 protein C16orf87 homolog isoform X2 [Dendronephthya gigantea]
MQQNRPDRQVQIIQKIDSTPQQISSEVLNFNADMSSTKQCISCNREMPVSNESCVCGHVLSDIKSLEGKRYSGYREELYSRLEIRRILEDSDDKPKRSRLKQKSTSSEKQNFNSLHKPQMKRRHKRKSPGPQHLTSNTGQDHSQKSQMKSFTASQQENIDDNLDKWYLNPRFNFADALADINKRLISQTSFWIRL